MRKIVGTFIFLLLSCFSFATHQVGGYISYKWLGGYTYLITINDYTNSCCPLSSIADRDGLRINYGDGKSDSLLRMNGESGNYWFNNGDPVPYGELLCDWEIGHPPTSLNGARKYDEYQGIHTYPGPGNYHIWMDDQDRMANIANITNSVNVDYYMYNTLTIPPRNNCFPDDTDYINSPLITNPPVCQFGCTGQCYYYNPGAYIPNLPPGADDSISYAMGSSLMLNPAIPTVPELATGYYNPGATVNQVTGTLTWCSPKAGLWNFVILMITYQRTYTCLGGLMVKNIIPIDTTELELEVVINSICFDPIVNSKDTCVEAGADVSITYTATIANSDPLYITAAGEPFSLSPPATLSNYGPQPSPLVTRFNWLTDCNEVRENPYEVVIRATDKTLNFSDSAFYSGYGTSLITVVGPPPQHLMATNEGTTVCLHWGPTPCPNDTIYNIYRQKGCSNWKHGYCETGVPAYTGYTLIGTNYGLNDTTYCDSNGGAGLSPGVSYSYIVDGVFPLPDGSQSYASNDTCVTIKLSVPLITNVSVNQTDPANGKMFVRWMKPTPDVNDLDTNQYPPPYTYVLERAAGMNGNSFSPIVTYTSTVFKTQLDTTFMDMGLDTRDSSYNYKVDFYYGSISNPKIVGASGTASSIYLKLQRENKSMNLAWAASVPWDNDTFYVYREDPAPALPVYNFLAKTTNTKYTDTGLHNGSQYCYYVKSYSEYTGAPHIGHPLYDSSETICGIPQDTIAPCSPPLNIAAKCVLYEDSIIWSNPDRLCPQANKVTSYQIYYTPVENGDMSVIATINNPNDTIYVNSNLTSVAGCYAVLAFDSAGQSSALNTVCVDNCPYYQLPNVFTPNGDGTNDLFTPLEPFRYVKDIDINIFNRWGQIVFHTTDPIINWNGNVDNSGGPCPDGIYYYVCVVNEIRVQGIVPVTLKGFIQLIRN